MSSSDKQAFVTFSSDLINSSNIIDYKNFIKKLEEDCHVHIKYRWFDNNGKGVSPSEIHKNATRAISESDIFIAETTIGSIGVGQQINYAVSKKIPTFLCINNLYRDEKKSLYFKGTQAKNLTFIHYNNLNDLIHKLSEKIASCARPKMEKFNFLATNELKAVLKIESDKLKISQSELLRNIVEEWISSRSKTT